MWEGDSKNALGKVQHWFIIISQLGSSCGPRCQSTEWKGRHIFGFSVEIRSTSWCLNETYISDMKPQNNFFGFLCDACLLAWSAASRIIAALIDNVFSWRVHLRSMLWHLQYLFVWPSTQAFGLGAHDVLANALEDRRCKEGKSEIDIEGSRIWFTN